MGKSPRYRLAVTIFAASVLAASLVVAQSGRPGARRPVRALGPGGDADATSVNIDVTKVGVVKPTLGEPARAQVIDLGDNYRAVPTTRSFSTTELKLGEEEELRLLSASVGRSDVIDQADQLQAPHGGATSITLGTGFAGLKQGNNGGPSFWSIPPDTVGDVGATEYVQAVNTVFAVYDKATGNRLFGPAPQSSLFGSNFCGTHDHGDPIVLYDEAADRFLISQFALNLNTETYYECIAVSQTGTPSDGLWYAYQFTYPKPFLNDYPKFGVWPDAYYASFNQFDLSARNPWRGSGAIAYERDQMLLGNMADQIYFNLYPIRRDLFLPSDWDSPTAPPAGMPNVFLTVDSDDAYFPFTDDQVEFWAFDPNFVAPANSTFTQLAVPSNNTEGGLDVANFNPWVCGAPKFACIPQKNSNTKLDALNDRLMNRLQYWNQGGDQHLVVNHTVKSNDGGAGVRWYDFINTTQNPSSPAWAVNNQGTYGPGKLHRWMGSAARNDLGDLAIGYSTSSGARFPGISVAARAAADVANTLTAAAKVFTGTGSEKGQANRWGDYSAMSVDPTDNCTFWYTQQYYSKTGQWRWATRIQSFTVSACV